MSVATNGEGEGTGAARVAVSLSFLASPAFALMAWVSAGEASAMALCAAGTGTLPVDGMTAMYLLMCLFHLQPWIRLVSWPARAGSRR